MSRALWTIAILGFVTMLVLVVSFLVIFKTFGESPTSHSAKMSMALRNEFHFDSVTTRLVAETHKSALAIQYETHADSKFSVDVQNREMQAVALFGFGKLDTFDKKRVDEIRVHRIEVRGSGCWQRTYMADLTVPNPTRGASEPFPLPPPK